MTIEGGVKGDSRVDINAEGTEGHGNTQEGRSTEAPEATGSALPAYQAHPIGPLSGEEIERSSSLIRQVWPTETKFQFKVITLLEPAKAELVPYLDAERKGQKHRAIDRRAFVVYYLKNTVGKALSSLSHFWLTGQAQTARGRGEPLAGEGREQRPPRPIHPRERGRR